MRKRVAISLPNGITGQDGGHIEYKGHIIPYAIRRNSRAKRVILKVGPDRTITVVAPPTVPAPLIHEFVGKKAEWIYTKTVASQIPLPPERRYASGEVFPWLGGEIVLKIEKGERLKGSIENGILLITLPHGLAGPNEVRMVRAAIEFFSKRELYLFVQPYVLEYAKKFEVQVPAIQIRTKKTNWGTCTKRGIFLNSRLCMAPPFIIEYVVAHEICHKIHNNHSSLFWNALEKALPDYKERKLFMKRNGHLWVL